MALTKLAPQVYSGPQQRTNFGPGVGGANGAGTKIGGVTDTGLFPRGGNTGVMKPWMGGGPIADFTGGIGGSMASRPFTPATMGGVRKPGMTMPTSQDWQTNATGQTMFSTPAGGVASPSAAEDPVNAPGGSTDFDESTGFYKSTGTGDKFHMPAIGHNGWQGDFVPTDMAKDWVRHFVRENAGGRQLADDAPEWQWLAAQAKELGADINTGLNRTQYNQLVDRMRGVLPQWMAGGGGTGGTGPGGPPPPPPGGPPPPPGAPTRPTPTDAPVFDAPDLNLPPEYIPGQFTGSLDLPPGYEPGTFRAPTREEMLADPGYQFRERQSNQAFENSAAARGVLRSGGSIKDFLNYAQDRNSQEYGQVYGRAADTFDRNERGRLTGAGMAREDAMARFNAATGIFDRNEGNRFAAAGLARDDARARYNAELEGRQLEYAPGLLSWQNQNRWNELGMDDDWRRETYGRDDDWRRTIFKSDDEYRRWRASVGDEQWIKDFDESRRRYLSDLGAR